MRKGFTLIEVLVTLAIIATIAAVTTLNLVGRRNTRLLSSTVQQIGALLREAQSDSITEKNGLEWGVYFTNSATVTTTQPFYALFSTADGSFATSGVVSQYILPSGICYATSTLNFGSSTAVVFSSVSGAPLTPATITLSLVVQNSCNPNQAGARQYGSIVRNSSGKIFFDDFNRSNL